MPTATKCAVALLPVALHLTGLAGPASAAVLPFEAAAGLVLEQGLEGEAARATLEGAQSYARRAGGLPGPSISADVENFGGRGQFRSLDSAEITISASQPLRIGPRATAQRSLARAEAELAAAQLGSAARVQLATLTRLYAAAAAAAQLAGIAAERDALAERLAVNARRRLAAGDVAEVEARRVEVEAALAAAELQSASLQAGAAADALARFVGQEGATPAPDWLDTVATSPLDVPDAMVAADQPLWDAERAVASGAQAAARAERLPTADLMLGARRFRDADATVAVAGVTLGLPLWNGNRGAIDRAAAATKRADLDAAIKARDARNRRTAAVAEAQSAKARLQSIETSALPAARRAYELSQRGYAAGALPYRDLADSTETLIGVAEARVSALQAIAEARATLLELSGDTALIGLSPSISSALPEVGSRR